MPVHTLGYPAEMDALIEIAAKHKLAILEDCCEAHGSSIEDRKVGSFGVVSTFSFFVAHNMTTGEGGMITTNDVVLAARLRTLRSQGASRSTFDRKNRGAAEVFAELGYNYRMTDLQAAIGLEQLKKLDGLIARRRTLAARYNAALSSLPGLQLPAAPEDPTHSYQSYMVRVTVRAPRSRDEVLAALRATGVGAMTSVQAIHLEPLYQARFGKIRLPGTEQVFCEGLILPLFPSMTEAEQDHVIQVLREALGGS